MVLSLVPVISCPECSNDNPRPAALLPFGDSLADKPRKKLLSQQGPSEIRAPLLFPVLPVLNVAVFKQIQHLLLAALEDLATLRHRIPLIPIVILFDTF